MDASLTRRLVKHQFTPCCPARPSHTASLRLRFCLAGSLLFTASLAGAVSMTNDPNGFEGIPWGAMFSETATFVKVEESGRFQTYELKAGRPSLGGTSVDSMRFTTVDRQFARVTVRYHGQAEHDRILAYLESRYGPLDRTPGQIAAGAVQLYSWSGPTTEITLRYLRRENQGIIFFESQSLRSSFTEGASATAQ